VERWWRFLDYETQIRTIAGVQLVIHLTFQKILFRQLRRQVTRSTGVGEAKLPGLPVQVHAVGVEEGSTRREGRAARPERVCTQNIDKFSGTY
jgi:hypothetical protein